jgi:predicted  nucleic acid-binding Zn-ribbon protein
MGRKTDNAPVWPTCPLIDETISQVHDWYKESEEISRNEYQGFEIRMEKIRDANGRLRDWGNDECRRADEAENDLENAQDTISDLKKEIEDLKEEIKTLEKELSQA